MSLFNDFLLATLDNDGLPSVLWRLHSQNEAFSDETILQFAFPYPKLLKKVSMRSMPTSEEFVFVLSKASATGEVTRTYGFCRRYLGSGFGGRLDVGVRFPEVLVMLTHQPLFSLYSSVLRAAQGLRLLNPLALNDFVAKLCTPVPFPMANETFRVLFPRLPGIQDELRFKMPSSGSPSCGVVVGDVSGASLLHSLGARRYLLL